MTQAYAELGADAGSRLFYAVQFDSYKDRMVAQDTHQVSITGVLNTHFGAGLRRWEGRFRVQASPPAGYGTIAQLEALHASQDTALSWIPPEEVAAIEVRWIGDWAPEYIVPPLTEALVPFVLHEIS